MDVLVLIEECDEAAAGRGVPVNGPAELRPLAYLRSAPEPRGWSRGRDDRGHAGAREIVTLCGPADADRLAIALAAAVEGRRAAVGPASAVRQLGVWNELGAFGDAAWRDGSTGQVVSEEMSIPAATIAATAADLLRESGRLLRHTAAELSTRDWPEGTWRAISFTLPLRGELAPGRRGPDADDVLLASLREADGFPEGHADVCSDETHADDRLDERAA